MENLTLADIVSKDINKASVLEQYGLDYCCGGKQTLNDACATNNIEVSEVVNALEKHTAKDDTAVNFDGWDLDLMVDYIEKKHHRYIRQQIPNITQHLAKIAQVHGKKHPELLEIYNLFTQSANDLSSHLVKEEKVLFPFIRKVANQESVEMDIAQPIEMMKHEHDIEGERFKKISDLSNHYQIPADGCNTYKYTYELLHQFEKDLHRHIHLENNIVFPRALEAFRA